MKNQIKVGAIISYLNIILNILFTMLLTPFLIGGLGDSEYGVYKIIQSFSGQLSIASFGISTLIVRNIVYFKTQNEEEKKENFLFFAIIFTFIVALFILACGGGMYPFLDKIYSHSLSENELLLAKELFIFMVANMALNVISDSYIGIATAHEKYIVSNFVRTLKLVLRFVLIILLIKLGMGSLYIVMIDCFVTIISIIIPFVYSRFILNERPKFHYFDKVLFKQSITFAFAIFLQTIISQVNQNLDNTILGFMTDTSTVTMYSIALSIFTTFSALVTAIRGMFTPGATKLVSKEYSSTQITDFVIKPGRFQFVVAGLVICGFILFGKEFINLWVGDSYEPAYLVTIILLLSSVIPLIETTTVSILDAMMKRLGRSLILVGMCVINIVISIVLINEIGYIGAAIGTAISYFVGDGILLNIYLHKSIGLEIKRMFKEVFKGLLPAVLLSLLLGWALTLIPNGLIFFILKISVFSLMYLILIFFIGLNKEEKNMVTSVLLKMKR